MADMSTTSIAVAAAFGSLGFLWLYRRLMLQRGISQLQDKVVLITGASSGVGEGKTRKYLTLLPQCIAVLITGASSGVGKACAHAFYKAGCKLILCARREKELERVKKDCCAMTVKTKTYPPRVLPLDLSDLPSIPDKAKGALALYGCIDILINNGGISYRGVAMETQIEVDQRLMTVNYFGSVALTKALLPSMVERRSGFIVAVSSIQGKISIPYRTAYSASKFAMQAFFDCLRAEVADQGINVLVVSPSYIRTALSLSALLPDGTKHGVMDSTTAKGMPPEYVAQRIMGGVARQQQDLILSPIHHVISVYLRVLAPSIFNFIMRIRARNGMAGES